MTSFNEIGAVELLLVEDNASDAAYFEAVLEEIETPPHHMTWVTQMSEARDRLAHDSFDVIVCDLGLPDSEGLATVEKILECARGIPVVVHSGLIDDQVTSLAIQAGCQDYLRKGTYQREDVQHTIRQAIDRKEEEKMAEPSGAEEGVRDSPLRPRSRTPEVVKSLSVRYIGVLALLALFSVGTSLFLKATIDIQSTTAKEINVAARQRTLAEKISFLGGQLDSLKEGPERKRVRSELKHAISSMEVSHDALVNGNAKLGTTPPQTAELRALYFGPRAWVDREVKAHIAWARRLLETHGPDTQSEEIEHHHREEFIRLSSGTFLPALDSVVTQYQHDAEARTTLLRNWAFGVMAVTLLLLLASGLFVFRPMVARLGRFLAEVNLLSSAVEQSPVSVVITGIDGTIEYVNDRFCKVTGYSQEEAIGQNPRILKSGHTPQEEYERMWAELSAGKSWKGVFHNKKKNGELFWEEAAISPIGDESGKVAHFLAIKEDITEKRRIMEALSENEKRFRVLFERNGVAMYVHRHFRPLYANPAALDLIDFSDIGQFMSLSSTLAFIHPDDKQAVRTYHEARLEGGEAPDQYEMRVIRRHGEILSTINHSFPISWAGEQAVCTTLLDITDKRRAENALKENEKRFRELVESAGNSFNFFSVNPEGRFLYISPNSLDWYGISQEDVVGKNWGDAVSWSPDSAERGASSFEQCLAGEIPAPVEMSFVSVNEEERQIVSYPHPVKDETGKIIRIEGISVDITERLKLEAELHKAVEVAEKANQAKSAFLSSMSHELRTPLNAVIGFSQMLDYNPKEPLSPSQKKCVDRILKGGQHLLELINDVLDLSKIEAGRVDLSIEDVALGKVLDECESFVHPLAERHGVAVGMAAVSDLWVRADYTRLKQVLLNLLSNAIKYNRPDGRVEVACELKPDGRVEIAVADTGEGIPEDKRDELFKPFSRLGRENSGIEGTGIGLTITKRLMEMMGGDIDFDSVAGEGTTFHIHLFPAQKAAAGEGEMEAEPRPSEGAVRGKVLYVEDNPANMELMEMVVSRLEGVMLLTAPSGELGIELARDNQPDLIVLDIGLPGMDGFEILKRLREMEQTKDTPVFALTAMATKRDIERGTEAGFSKYLTKPFAVETVIDAMRGVFEGRARR